MFSQGLSNGEVKMKKLLLFVLILIPTISHAVNVKVLGNESMPFNGVIVEKNGDGIKTNNVGIIFEILQEATKHGAPEFIYSWGLPWKRAQVDLKNANGLTAIIPLTRTSDREKSFTWIAPLISYQTRISVFDRPKPMTIQQASKHRIGIISGSAHIPLLNRLGIDNLYLADNALANSKLLKFKRIDALVESEYVDTYNWEQSGFAVKDLKFTAIGVTKYIYIAGNLNFPKDVALRISQAIEKMRVNGKLQAILDKW